MVGIRTSPEFNLDAVALASRSSLVGILLRTALPSDRPSVLDFLRGLSRDELQCLAEFQGALIIESQDSPVENPYRFMAKFFSPVHFERREDPCDRAHKIFVVLAWIDHLSPSFSIRLRVS